MPEGMTRLFAGQLAWKLPADFQILVGPTSPHPLPKTYLDNTDKYGQLVKIKAFPDGEHTIAGYVAGRPFPNPAGPLKGYQILVDNWYRYMPRLMCNPDATEVLEDRYGNRSSLRMEIVFRHLNHISDAGQPITDERAPELYNTQYSMLTAPEDVKYTEWLTIYSVDPLKPENIFLFVPKLRRALRISSNGRCAPAFGTDYVFDDFNGGFDGGIAQFDATYLRDQEILSLVDADPRQYGDLSKYYQALYPEAGLGQMGGARQLRHRYAQNTFAKDWLLLPQPSNVH